MADTKKNNYEKDWQFFHKTMHWEEEQDWMCYSLMNHSTNIADVVTRRFAPAQCISQQNNGKQNAQLTDWDEITS